MAGDPRAAIATLRPIVDGPAATARARQNLAVAYGLAGDVDAARRLAQLDLQPDDVASNLAFLGMLREAHPPSTVLAALPAAVVPSDPAAVEAPAGLRPDGGATSAGATTPKSDKGIASTPARSLSSQAAS